MNLVGDRLPDEEAYRRMVAKVILFKTAESIARKIGFSAYRANAVTYTLALLSYRTLRRINLDSIWKYQETPQELYDTMYEWMPLVHERITETAFEQGRNVTEWAKNQGCWAVIQNLDVTIPSVLEDQLGEGLPQPNVGEFRTGRDHAPLTDEELHRQEKVMSMTGDDFASMLRHVLRYSESHGMNYSSWAAMTGCITSMIAYAENGWVKIPTPKQTKQVMKAIKFLEDREGKPSEEQA